MTSPTGDYQGTVTAPALPLTLAPRHTDSHTRSLLQPFDGQPSHGYSRPQPYSPQKQGWSGASQAGPPGGWRGPALPSPPVFTFLSPPGHASAPTHLVLETGWLLQEGFPSPPYPAQWSMVLWASKGDLPCPHDAPPLRGAAQKGCSGKEGLGVWSSHVAEGLMCWPQELGLCSLDVVWFEQRWIKIG